MKENIKLFKDIVLRFAKESKCTSYKVGCIAVKDNRVIASGVNGTYPGTQNCGDYMKNKHKEFTELDPTFPKYTDWVGNDHWRKVHHDFSEKMEIHGEQSILVDACRRGISLEGVDIYVSHMPCIQCSKLLAFLKPRIIYYVHEYDKSQEESKKLLKNANVLFVKI